MINDLRSEDEITDCWHDLQLIEISIICTTYNQESYLEDALIGFLSQKINVPYEIVLHDDCSTDGTRDIISKYQKKYPKIIIPIIQKKNIYSQGKSPWIECFPVVRGKYIAICEGDDFWISASKLQSQYELMENNEHLSFCCHNAKIAYIDQGNCELFNDDILSGTYSTKDLLLRRWFVPTASIFIRSASLPNEIPKWFHRVKSQDLALEIVLSTRGAFMYKSAIMSTYRKNAVGSLSINQINTWNYLNNRIFLFCKLLAYLPVKMSPLVLFDIFVSFAKSAYARAIYLRKFFG